MANLAGQNPRAIEATCHFLTNVTCHNEAAEMDVKHVTLCFAAEVVAVNPSAGPRLAQVVCAMPDFGSPLLMAETWAQKLQNALVDSFLLGRPLHCTCRTCFGLPPVPSKWYSSPLQSPWQLCISQHVWGPLSIFPSTLFSWPLHEWCRAVVPDDCPGSAAIGHWPRCCKIRSADFWWPGEIARWSWERSHVLRCFNHVQCCSWIQDVFYKHQLCIYLGIYIYIFHYTLYEHQYFQTEAQKWIDVVT